MPWFNDLNRPNDVKTEVEIELMFVMFLHESKTIAFKEAAVPTVIPDR